LAEVHRDLIITLAARYRLPAIYPFRTFVRSGGLISYGPDIVDQFRRAAGYVDRILKGEKPADLPVQQPTKLELAINLKAAKGLDLEVPPTLLALNPAGKAIGFIALPERAANVCFGGRYRNRLFMAASHSIYSLYVNTQGVAGG
jgi:hypothetical protein